MAEIVAKILRFNPEKNDKTYFETYKLTAEEPLSILTILRRIQEEIDPTLAFRNSICNRGICGACFVKVNGKVARGCKTLVNPGDEVTVEPSPKYPVIRDVVVDFSVEDST